MTSAHSGSNKSTASNIENVEKGKELKIQLLSLSRRIGNVIGKELFPKTFCCDSIHSNFGEHSTTIGANSFLKLKTIFHEFVTELLEGKL